jgi:uncharacterized membrane protein YuzA (DUF378 family)
MISQVMPISLLGWMRFINQEVSMTGQTCILCRVFGVVAVIGLLNLGVEGVIRVNYLERFLGESSMITRVIYVVMGVAGIASLVKMFGMACPGCCKK